MRLRLDACSLCKKRSASKAYATPHSKMQVQALHSQTLLTHAGPLALHQKLCKRLSAEAEAGGFKHGEQTKQTFNADCQGRRAAAWGSLTGLLLV